MQKEMGEYADADDTQEIGEDELPMEMPVMWHQTLLTLVQCYKVYFTVDQRKKINALIRVQTHYAITPEIKRELASTSAAQNAALQNDENM